MKKKAIFIYNPLSGNHIIPRNLDMIIGKFQERGIVLQPYRILNMQSEELIDELKNGNYSYVVASGGDGTLNYIANLILANNLDLPMGILPSGTCNDFARCLKLPSSLKDCIDVILNGITVEVDAGLINNEQYFLSTCAGGIFVDVSFNTNNEFKKNLGPFAYYLKAIGEMGNIRPFKIKITTDSVTIEDEALLFAILNGKNVGGFSNVIREADLSDGFMDIMLVRNCSHIDLAGLFFKILNNDATTFQNKYITKMQAKTCTIESDSNVSVSIDGEEGRGLPLEIRFINKALKVFVKNKCMISNTDCK